MNTVTVILQDRSHCLVAANAADIRAAHLAGKRCVSVTTACCDESKTFDLDLDAVVRVIDHGAMPNDDETLVERSNVVAFIPKQKPISTIR